MSAHWLCIEAHFLAGYYHGRRRQRSQWPPNPHRLFQALVAAGTTGFRRTSFCDVKKSALRWLETQPTPEIIAPESHESPPIKLYVPNNDTDKEIQTRIERTEKLLHPHTLRGDATVRFLWPIKGEEQKSSLPHIKIICAEARRLHSLGLGIDLVAGNGRVLSDSEKRALQGEIWVADENGSGWRVPIKGSLDEILERYRRQGERLLENYVVPPVPPVKFLEVAYIPQTQSKYRRVYPFRLVDQDGRYRSFNPRRSIEVSAWVRHAVHEKARSLKLDSDVIERFICGHGKSSEEKNNRLSYLPIPTIPVRGRDGGIRRVLIATPFNHSGKAEENVMSHLDNMPLISEQSNFMANLQKFDTDGITDRYLLKSKGWGSVTPLVLPGHDDHRLRKAHRLIIKSLEQAGYTTPIEEICLRNGPIFPGSEMARTYRLPAYLKGFTCVHAILTFSEDVLGPVVIGAGRHIGLGIFARLNS